MNSLRPLLVFSCLSLAFPAKADDVIRLSPGRSATFTLQENVTTGYSWRIDQIASENLDILSISDAGRSVARRRMVGSPSQRHWKIRALKPGHAEIVFVYQRPWEPAPVQTRRVDVDVAP